MLVQARLKQSGSQQDLRGVSYEIYRNNPTQVPKDELRTEMYVPLA